MTFKEDYQREMNTPLNERVRGTSWGFWPVCLFLIGGLLVCLGVIFYSIILAGIGAGFLLAAAKVYIKYGPDLKIKL